jgi:hypothetical protein
MSLQPKRIIDIVYKMVSDGILWQFLRLSGKRLSISGIYSLLDPKAEPEVYKFIDAIIKAAISSSPHTTPCHRFPAKAERWEQVVETLIFAPDFDKPDTSTSKGRDELTSTKSSDLSPGKSRQMISLLSVFLTTVPLWEESVRNRCDNLLLSFPQ